MSDAAESTVRGLPATREPEEPTPALPPLPLTPVSRGPAAPWYRTLKLVDWLALLSLAIVLLVVASALWPAALAPYSPTYMSSDAILAAPSVAHPFGTDLFGRDVLSLVVFGARQSLVMGVCSVLVSCIVGVALGILAGYFGGTFDLVLMRVVDVWMSIPNILLAISLSAALGPSPLTTILCVSVAFVPRYARVLRAQTLGLRVRPFILAARAAGASHLSILQRHILPHCVATIVVLATLGVGQSIIIGSSLSFLGLGVNDECPDWGYLLTQGRSYLTVAWWTVTYPGLAITTLVISVNLIGDALRRWLDPRSVQHLVLARRARRS
jgi:peptide/nickel transport system permease protein